MVGKLNVDASYEEASVPFREQNESRLPPEAVAEFVHKWLRTAGVTGRYTVFIKGFSERRLNKGRVLASIWCHEKEVRLNGRLINAEDNEQSLELRVRSKRSIKVDKNILVSAALVLDAEYAADPATLRRQRSQERADALRELDRTLAQHKERLKRFKETARRAEMDVLATEAQIRSTEQQIGMLREEQ